VIREPLEVSFSIQPPYGEPLLMENSAGGGIGFETISFKMDVVESRNLMNYLTSIPRVKCSGKGCWRYR